jgi:hypothetical protein
MATCTGSARVTGGQMEMDEQWLTYADAAVQLGVTPEAARRRAIRGKWARLPGNDGRTRVRLPDHWSSQGTPDVRPDNSALVQALEAHVATLKGENETLKSQLAAAETRVIAAEARAGKQAAEFAERNAKLADALASERAKTEKAIAEFVALARRLAELAEEQRRPWWKRLVR